MGDSHLRDQAKAALRKLLKAGLDPTPENFARHYRTRYRSDILDTICASMSGLFLEHPDLQAAVGQIKSLNDEGDQSGLLAQLKFIEEQKTDWLSAIAGLRQVLRDELTVLIENHDQCTQLVKKQCSGTSPINTESLKELQAYHKASATAWARMDELSDVLNGKLLALEGLLGVLEQGAPLGNPIADQDPLTNLLNRRGFMRQLERTPQAGTLLALDLDYFKALNDRYGHPAGDAVLKTVAEILRSECRAKDAVGRFGGEEFLVFLPEVSLGDGAKLAERLRRKFSTHPLQVSPVEQAWVTASIGVVRWDRARSSFAEAYARADKALYEAKHQGRNCVVTHDAEL